MSSRDDYQPIIDILRYIGEDPNREGLKDTPKRVLKAYNELFSGYTQNPEDVMKVFEDGAEAYDQMVVLKSIEFTSFCLEGSTFIDTPRGRIPIKYLPHGEFVYAWDEDNCKMVLARAINPRITARNKTLWRIFSDKDTILCTGEHKFLTHTRGWVRADHLTVGDSIVALNRGAIVEQGTTPRSFITWTGLKTQMPEHRFVYEEVNGPHPKGHCVHHINKQPNDNRPENLTALSKSDHVRLHRLEDGPTGFALFTDAQRRAMRTKQIKGINRSQTEEVRKKRASSVKAYWDSLTEEERKVRNHRVLLVEKTNWKDDVWCMDVPGYENFVANGMVVHNCEHHMLPFTGIAHIGYIPFSKIIGLSKLARLLDIYAKRLQVQERLTTQIVEALDKHLKPQGSACVIEASHMCMACRGIRKQNAVMVTSKLSGEFMKPEVRAEFFNTIRS